MVEPMLPALFGSLEMISSCLEEKNFGNFRPLATKFTS